MHHPHSCCCPCTRAWLCQLHGWALLLLMHAGVAVSAPRPGRYLPAG